MALDIVTIPCLSDNYAYLVQGPDGVCLVDAPEPGPIIDALDARGWSLDVILLTHHHHDHVGGVAELRNRYACKVMGPRAEEAKLPKLDTALEEGMNGGTGEAYTVPLHVPGHTLGHMAFHFPKARAVFSADSLMALGCGRVFEGTMEMMWESLQKFLAMPDDTMVYSGHEYTSTNARFARTIEPDNEALKNRIRMIESKRSLDQPTVPASIGEEKATNPFLRAGLQEVKALLDMTGASDAEVFAEIRRRKDSF